MGSVVKRHNGILLSFAAGSDRFGEKYSQKYSDSLSERYRICSAEPGNRSRKAGNRSGTGSGALTIAFAYQLVPQEESILNEMRPEMQRIAIENLRRTELDSRVDFKIRNIADGFDEKDVDAIFLDVPNSYDYLPQVRAALKPGGFFGSILPTMNQVTKLLGALKSDWVAFTE